MREKLQAVQRLWVILCALSLLLCGGAVYAYSDVQRHAAVAELSRFEEGFDGATVSATLTASARAQATTPLSSLAAHITGPGVPEVTGGNSSLTPFGEVTVATLGEAAALAEPTTTTMHKVDEKTLGRSLAFRLARASEPGPLTLSGLRLLPTSAGPEASQKLLAAEEARLASVAARKTLVSAQTVQDRLEELYEQRLKWKAPRKVLRRTFEKRSEARRERAQANAAWEAAFATYQAAAEAAMVEPDETKVGAKVTDMALAEATFQRKNGKDLVVRVPAPVTAVTVTLPALTGVDFTHTRAQNLWDAVAALTPQKAVERAESTYGLFSREFPVGPVKVGGPLILQLLSAVVPMLLWMLLVRSREVNKSYDPFAQHERLPRAGTGVAALDFLILSVLPTLSTAATSWALFGLGHLPVLPLPATLLAAAFGIRAYNAIHELNELKDAVMRSSVPPPAVPPTSVKS